MTGITVIDLAQVVYSSGKVFDGLRTGRLDTVNFLRSGSLHGVTSRADLALLEDLRDVAQFVVDHAGQPVHTAYVRSVNAMITRSGALRPGEFRHESQHIGVGTRYGRHEPDAATEAALERIIADAAQHEDPREAAIALFVGLAKAQPFEDGNKRTALFAANGTLLAARAGVLLSVPVDERDPSVAEQFNDLLARAYVYGEDGGVAELLRIRGLIALP